MRNLAFVLCLVSVTALAGETRLFEAEKKFSQAASRPFAELKTELEKKEWAEARLSWIALERLRGRNTSALQIWNGCKAYCEKYGKKSSWQAVKDWAKAQKN